jgi:hypothetical protein
VITGAAFINSRRSNGSNAGLTDDFGFADFGFDFDDFPRPNNDSNMNHPPTTKSPDAQPQTTPIPHDSMRLLQVHNLL